MDYISVEPIVFQSRIFKKKLYRVTYSKTDNSDNFILPLIFFQPSCETYFEHLIPDFKYEWKPKLIGKQFFTLNF